MIAVQILKIIGIVLLCIVGLVILILLLVMFAPFRYSLAGKGKNEDVTITAAVRWLLGFVTVRADYYRKHVDYYLRVAGIRFMKGSFDVGNEDELIEALEQKISASNVEYRKEDYPGKKKLEKKLKDKEKDAARAEKEALKAEKAAAKQAAREEKKKEKKPLGEKLSELWEKIRNIIEVIGKAKYIITAPVTKRAWQHVKVQLFKMLGSIRPRSMKGNLHFGFEDPSRTAEVYGVASSIAAMIDHRLMIVPEMEEAGLSMDVIIRGRIFVGYVVLLGLKIITNRDVRRVIRYTKKNLIEPMTGGKTEDKAAEDTEHKSAA